MKLLAWLFLTSSAALAQLDPGTITVTAIGPQPAGAGRVQVRLSVRTGLRIEFEDVLRMLAPLEISERHLTRAELDQEPAYGLYWEFQFSRPFSTAKELLTALAKLHAEPHEGMDFRSEVYGWPADFAQECPYSSRIAEARGHAQSIAAAAGLRVGRVIAVSDGSEVVTAPSERAVSPGVMGVPGSGPMEFTVITQNAPHCLAVVQFELLR